jgi:hypothetical protein
MLQTSIFETFVPSKSKVFHSSTQQSIPEAGSSVSAKSSCRVADLLSQLRSNRNALAIAVTERVGVLDREDTSASEKVVRSIPNVIRASRLSFGIGPSNQKLISKLEIEANFDLRSLLMSNDVAFSDSAYGILRTSCVPSSSYTSILEQKLKQWADSQRCYSYPDGSVRSYYLKPAGLNSDTAMNQFWQEPSLQDVSDFSVMRRRKLKWQTALCSAIDELLLEAPPNKGCTYCNDGVSLHDLSAGSMESFYVIGSDIDSATSHFNDREGNAFDQQQSSAKSLPISAIFMNHRCCRDSSRSNSAACQNSGSEDENISCVLTGAKRSFIDRLIELGANPKELVDKQEYLRRKATETWRKKSNRHISSAGRLQVLCCTVLYCTVLCCAVLCCAVLCCAVLCCAVLCCAVLCCAVLCCAVLCCPVLSCPVLICAMTCCLVFS